MATTIQVRALDANGDPLRGAGLANFVSDLDATAQILATRLRLLMGEWFEDTSDGTPLFQTLLGQPTTIAGVTLVLRSRILSSPYVISIQSLNVSYQPTSRAFTFVASVQTAFGSVSLSA